VAGGGGRRGPFPGPGTPIFRRGRRRAWAASDVIGGTRRREVIGSNPYRTVVINEFLAHTDEPAKDFIELHNYHTQELSLAGCVLTDNPATNQFIIPPGTIIPALGFVAFNQEQLGFALDAAGEAIYLKNRPARGSWMPSVRAARERGVQRPRAGWSAGHSRLANPSEGLANSPPRPARIVINEIMFNPITATTMTNSSSCTIGAVHR